MDDERLAEAIKRIDAANKEDPRTELVDGRPESRELLFARRVDEWEEEKTLRVLQRTLRKMTPDVREHALRLKLGERERDLLHRAAS